MRTSFFLFQIDGLARKKKTGHFGFTLNNKRMKKKAFAFGGIFFLAKVQKIK